MVHGAYVGLGACHHQTHGCPDDCYRVVTRSVVLQALYGGRLSDLVRRIVGMDEAGTSESVAQNVSATLPASAAPNITASALPLMPVSAPLSMAQVRGLVAATVAALKQLPTIGYQAANAELLSVVGELDELAAFGTAGVVTMTTEAEQRGVIAESQFASTAGWVRDAAWHLRTGGSGVVAKCVAILRRHDLAALADAVRTTDVTPNVAVTGGIGVRQDFTRPRCWCRSAGIGQDDRDGRRPRTPLGETTPPTTARPARAGRCVFRMSRTPNVVTSICPLGGKTPGCSTTNSPWTRKAAQYWKRSGRCRSHSPNRMVNQTRALSADAGVRPWSRCAAGLPRPVDKSRRRRRRRSM